MSTENKKQIVITTTSVIGISAGVLLLALLISKLIPLLNLRHVKFGKFTYGLCRLRIKRYHKNDGNYTSGNFAVLVKI
jgi:hypothetical protein